MDHMVQAGGAADAEPPREMTGSPPARGARPRPIAKTPHLIIIPGLMLHPSDYAPLTSRFESAEVLDIWPATVDGVKAVGPPNSDTHDAWMKTTTQRCAAALERHPGCIVLAHSAGMEIVRRLNLHAAGTPTKGAPARLRREDGPRIVALGCRPFGDACHIVGEDDSLAEPHADAHSHRVAGGHFNCVTREAYERCQEDQRALGAPVVEEEHVDASAEIAAIVIREFGPKE